MRRSITCNTAALSGVTLLAGLGGASALTSVTAVLIGFEEVPAISTQGTGAFRATLRANSITYRLSYANLDGNVVQAHIHFAQKGVAGGISVFLCSNLAGAPPGTPACPGTTAGSVQGSVTAAGVIGPAGQNIPAGDLAKVLQAIRTGFAYANVHTNRFPSGEIRGQIVVE
jgi:hypothetical protein